MNTLPALSNTMQTNSKAAATGKNSLNPDAETIPISQLFVDVLARQISESKNITEMKSDATLTEIVLDSDTAEKSAQVICADMATPTTTDLLATLMPQPALSLAVAPSNQTASPKLVADVSSGTSAIPAAPAKARFGSDELVVATSAAARPATTSDMQTDPGFAQKQLQDMNAGLSLNAKNLTEYLPATTAPPPALPGATALQALTNLSSVPAQSMPLVINTPLYQGRWADEFSQKITWLATSNQDQHAELHLNPPQLGPLDVVLKVSGDQASAMFTSAHAAVREAIELSIPKLRELLADNGIMLGSATVSDQSPRDQRSDLGHPRQSTENGRLPEVTTTDSTLSKLAPVHRHIGVVDTFA